MTNFGFEHRPAPLVFTGFMGTGKTCVGRLVAEKLGREFLDMDAIIEANEEMPISQIFETRGESYFRAREAELCARLARRENLVIATGGGALVNPQNRAQFADAFIICLDAAPDEILARLRGAKNRPLLAAPKPRQRIVELLDARRDAYAQIEWHVDTTGKTIEQVAEEIVAPFQPRKLCVTASDSVCPIFVGSGYVARVGKLMNLTPDLSSPNCAIITNPRVHELYAAPIVASLRARGVTPRVIEIPDGERFKTIESASRVYDQLLDAQFDRHSMIFALGGGVIGDLAGFVAATYLRGVSFVQMPTTLLAMVDASIGGKVAVDHPRGKNLVGAFKQPHAVIADPDVLATLPDVEFSNGMAEVVKHGIIGDAGLFERLEIGNCRSEVGSWIGRAMQVKIDIVARDPLERGERAKLNLGHTFGHAFELLSNFELPHGAAVAIGLICAARLAARRDLCDARLATRIENLLAAVGLPTRVPRTMSGEAVLAAMATDKKRVAARLRFVLPRALGDVVVTDDVNRQDLLAVLDESR